MAGNEKTKDARQAIRDIGPIRSTNMKMRSDGETNKYLRYLSAG